MNRQLYLRHTATAIARRDRESGDVWERRQESTVAGNSLSFLCVGHFVDSDLHGGVGLVGIKDLNSISYTQQDNL